MQADRAPLIDAFLERAGWGAARRERLAADASFRRYDRVVEARRTAVLMDAPPPMEDVGAYHRIDRILVDLGFSAPRTLAVDENQGLMLLEDLGDRTFTRALAAGEPEEELYRLAVDLLVALHRAFDAGHEAARTLPPYDDARLLEEALLLTDWYLPAVSGRDSDPASRAAYLAAWRAVLPRARALPPTLVLRDYHVDNLMILDERAGLAACGLLDFQDAVIGPPAYDLVSLLEDARRDVSPAVAEAMLARYLGSLPARDRAAFRESYAVLGAQRNAKIIGIFTRLWRRDGKPQYLRHLPRLWRLIENGLTHPALAPVRDWFAAEVPPALRRVPRAEAET